MKHKKVIINKKNGKTDVFDKNKIVRSIVYANMDVPPEKQMTEGRANLIADEILEYCSKQEQPVSSMDVREKVESAIIVLGSEELAKRYIRYGASKNMLR